MKENWKDIPGYEEHYQVSDLGRVKSLDRMVHHSISKLQFFKGRILKFSTDADGYLQIVLTLNKIRKGFKVQKLVAMAFLGHEPCGMSVIVDHDNNIRTDNRACNLILTSCRENTSKDRWRQNYSSKYVGVSWHKPNKKWVAKITIGKKYKHLGYFDIELEAHEAYQKALKNLS